MTTYTRLKKFLKINWFFLVLALCSSISSQASLLEKPISIDEKHVDQTALATTLDMKWTSELQDTQLSIAFKHQNGQALMHIEIQGDLPLILQKHKDQFQFKEQEGHKRWLYFYGASHPDINSMLPTPTLEEDMGIIYPPRKIDQIQAKKITIDEIAKLISNKKCVFYTGAGISSATVPTMTQLMSQLGFSQKENFIDVIDKALEDPQRLISVMKNFYNSCLIGRPTQAHTALKSIAYQKNWGLITENLDLLHQRSGIKPLTHGGRDWIRKNITTSNLKKIDYVIAIGLASDESGFLGWYKHHNSKAKIIALNLKQPSYLDDQDYFIEGDIQELIPCLEQRL